MSPKQDTKSQGDNNKRGFAVTDPEQKGGTAKAAANAAGAKKGAGSGKGGKGSASQGRKI